MVEISAMYPSGIVGSTLDNLKAAADGEKEEHSKIYPEFAKIANEEGFPQIASVFSTIAKIEAHHEQRYRMLLENVSNGTVFKKASTLKWVCRECGHVHEGPEAPKMCPGCQHPQAFFQVLVDSY